MYTVDEVRLYHTSGKNLVSQDTSLSLPKISIGKQTTPSNANDELSLYLEDLGVPQNGDDASRPSFKVRTARCAAEWLIEKLNPDVFARDNHRFTVSSEQEVVAWEYMN